MDLPAAVPAFADDIILSGSVGAERYEFPLRVQTNISYSTGRVLSYGIRLGGNVHSTSDKDVCVFLSITAPPGPPLPEDDSLPRYENHDEHMCKHKVAGIVQVCCAVGARLHGTATMLRAACAYALRVFPWVESFSLTDTSYVTTASGSQLRLPPLCLCTSGATWYEREFGANLRDASIHREYRRLVTYLLQTPGVMPRSITELFARARVQCPETSACMQLEACYASASTLQEFFCALKASRSRDEYQQLVGPWVSPLMERLLDGLYLNEWLVPASNFQSQDIQVGSSFRGAHIGHWLMPPPHSTGDMFHPMEDI